MFICAITKKASKHGEPLNKIVVATRPRVYTSWIRDEETNQWVEIEIGRGSEIVKEVSASQEGLDSWNSLTPDEQERFAKSL